MEFKEWVRRQTVDRAVVSIRIGNLLSIATIACGNHVLQSEVKLTKERVPGLVSILKRVRENFKDVKASIKNPATLRNLTSHIPILANETR